MSVQFWRKFRRVNTFRLSRRTSRVPGGHCLRACRACRRARRRRSPRHRRVAACPNEDLVPAAQNLRRGSGRAAVPAQRGARRSATFRALQENAKLRRAAAGHSADMVAEGFFSPRRTSSTGCSTPATPAAATAGSLGENLAWGTGELATPRKMMAAWMDSPGHAGRSSTATSATSGFGCASGCRRTRAVGATITADFGGRAMIRPTLFLLALLALFTAASRPTAADDRPRRDAERHPGRDLRGTVAAAQAQAGTRRRMLAVHLVRRPDRRRRHGRRGLPRQRGPDEGRLRVRRRPPEPLRRLGGRAAGQRGDRPALPGRAGRRDEGAALRHGHALRPAVRGHPDRLAAGSARRVHGQLPRGGAGRAGALGDQGGPRNAIVLADGLARRHRPRAGGDDHRRRRASSSGAANPHNAAG